jgi:hypothetical protein
MALRKLQTEMDRTFKRVEEGIALFCEIWVRISFFFVESQLRASLNESPVSERSGQGVQRPQCQPEGEARG